MKLGDAVTLMNAMLSGSNEQFLEAEFKRVSIDSRQTQPGDLFFAFSQPDYQRNCFNGDFPDSTVYVPAAFEQGALAAVVRPDRFEEHRLILEPFVDKLIFVQDAIYALQLLAKGVYEQWAKPVVGITGSAGKTTAKEITSSLLKHSGRAVLSNEKNYNNNIGHPLTVLKLLSDSSYEVAVLEMAMSTPHKEISRLCKITPPDVAIVLNVLPVHIEHLGSIENIAKAKAEIVEGMKEGGTAVLNADDFRVSDMSKLSRGSVITFGINNRADIMAFDIEPSGFDETIFKLRTPNDEALVSLSLAGKHNVMNALAASAVGFVFGMTAQEIAQALSNIKPPPQRGEILKFKNGFTVINDSYNSNPDALISMVKTMIENASAGERKIVVAGEMLELGDLAEQMHYEAGRNIAQMGIDLLIGVRGFASQMVRGAKEAGLDQAVFIEDSDKAAEFLLDEIKTGDLVLIKGSRGVRMEKIVEKFLEKFRLES